MKFKELPSIEEKIKEIRHGYSYRLQGNALVQCDRLFDLDCLYKEEIPSLNNESYYGFDGTTYALSQVKIYNTTWKGEETYLATLQLKNSEYRHVLGVVYCAIDEDDNVINDTIYYDLINSNLTKHDLVVLLPNNCNNVRYAIIELKIIVRKLDDDRCTSTIREFIYSVAKPISKERYDHLQSISSEKDASKIMAIALPDYATFENSYSKLNALYEEIIQANAHKYEEYFVCFSHLDDCYQLLSELSDFASGLYIGAKYIRYTDSYDTPVALLYRLMESYCECCYLCGYIVTSKDSFLIKVTKLLNKSIDEAKNIIEQNSKVLRNVSNLSNFDKSKYKNRLELNYILSSTNLSYCFYRTIYSILKDVSPKKREKTASLVIDDLKKFSLEQLFDKYGFGKSSLRNWEKDSVAFYGEDEIDDYVEDVLEEYESLMCEDDLELDSKAITLSESLDEIDFFTPYLYHNLGVSQKTYKDYNNPKFLHTMGKDYIKLLDKCAEEQDDIYNCLCEEWLYVTINVGIYKKRIDLKNAVLDKDYNDRVITFISSRTGIAKDKVKECYGRIVDYRTANNITVYPDYIYNNNGRCEVIRQFSLAGVFVAEYSTYSQASKMTNISEKQLSNACNGSHQTAGGFIWRKVEKDSPIIKLPSVNASSLNKSKPISCFDKSGELIDSFDSVNQAAKHMGIDSSNIRSCANGKTKTAGGFIWKYDE